MGLGDYFSPLCDEKSGLECELRYSLGGSVANLLNFGHLCAHRIKLCGHEKNHVVGHLEQG